MKHLQAALVGTAAVLFVFLGFLGPIAIWLSHTHLWRWYLLQQLVLLLVLARPIWRARHRRLPTPPPGGPTVVAPRGAARLSVVLMTLAFVGYLAVYALTLPAVSAAHAIRHHPGSVVGRVYDSGFGKYSYEVAVFTVDSNEQIGPLAETDTLHFRSTPSGEVAMRYDTADPRVVMKASTYTGALWGTDFWLYALGWLPTVLLGWLYVRLYRRQTRAVQD